MSGYEQSEVRRDSAVSLDDGPLSADDVLATTRTVRRRLDFDRPVERPVVVDCLRLAFQSPNAGASQRWGWVVVDDPLIKTQMAELYRQGRADDSARFVDAASRPDPDGRRARLLESVQYLADNIHRSPYLVVPTMNQSFGLTTLFGQASSWGSILPAVWSLMLAMRARGLGSAWTTLHLHREHEMADLLKIPPGNVQVGMFPVAYTIGTRFSLTNRTISEKRIFWNGWSED